MLKQVVAAMGTPFAAIRGIPAWETWCGPKSRPFIGSWVFRNSGCVHVVEVLPDAQQAGARPWGFPRGFSVLALDVIKP